MTLDKAKVQKTELLENKDAKWVKLVKYEKKNTSKPKKARAENNHFHTPQHTYTAANGSTKTWESSQRLTRPHNISVDSVGIVAILRPTPDSPPCILLQKQFRPPIDALTIEVPAGLIDEGETPEACALRELKEETGYVGEIMAGGFGVAPLMYNDPGFCNTNVYMIHVTIDLDNPINKNPKPRLEDDEFIDCFTVPLRDLYAECERLEKEGYAIDARVGTLAEGIEVAKRLNIT